MSERKTLDERAQMTDLERLRHSCAHVMATAILRIWPDAQFAYGPPIENGFYYDFEMTHRITPDDFEKIEAEMKKIAKENQKFEYKAITREEAKAMAESGRLGGLTERPGNPIALQARPDRQDSRGRDRFPVSRTVTSSTSARGLTSATRRSART